MKTPKHTARYYVIKKKLRIGWFDSFYEAYRYGLNTFCSEDFLVTQEE